MTHRIILTHIYFFLTKKKSQVLLKMETKRLKGKNEQYNYKFRTTKVLKMVSDSTIIVLMMHYS